MLIRNRNEEINVRVTQAEKKTIRRKAAQCGKSMSEFLRALGTGAVIKEAPKEELRQAYLKLTDLHDRIRCQPGCEACHSALSETERLLLMAYHGEEADSHGCYENMGCS